MNRLSKETSPYLLQHAHNPVDWFPWCEEALAIARKADKPILVSIGYSACHWCHVMERESFEDADTARVMNDHFINIKIDREERPDLDHVYMDAVQAMTGGGGWPLHVFLTPEAKPFYGGTYFPPIAVHNRPSWREVLFAIAKAFKDKRSEIEEQANTLIEHLGKANQFGLTSTIDLGSSSARYTKEQLHQAFTQIMGQADRHWGGFGRAPKFPQTFTISFLLRYYHVTGNNEALSQALVSLDNMIRGGIYDHLGGGFARYSTDTEWLAPHFEKMLYDNALLVNVLCDAYQLTRNSRYETVIRDTLAFVERELMSQDGAFYSALDADSEGVEGKFYTWSKQEITNIISGTLGLEAAELFCSVYDISNEGNWEHTNIPRLLEWPDDKDLELLQQCRARLVEERSKRVRPGLDHKILLSWNAMMNIAFSKAAIVFKDKHYENIVLQNLALVKEVFERDAEIFHTASFNESLNRSGGSKIPAFLDDLALYADAQLWCAEWSSNLDLLHASKKLVEHIIEEFSDEEQVFFYYTGYSQNDVIVRKKEMYDGATPSGNAIMARLLWRLGIYFNQNTWKERALKMADAIHQMAIKYPTSFGLWADFLQEIVEGTAEITIMGSEAKWAVREVLADFLPYRVIMGSDVENQSLMLFKGKELTSGKTTFYYCREYTCSQPVFELEQLRKMIKNE